MNNYDQQIITSSNKNNYFIDENEDLLLLCHPAMKKIIHSGTDHLNTLSYYKKKYQFLKKHGFFKNFSRKQVVEGRLNVSNFEEYIANSRQVIFETTEKCNLKCTYCAYGLLYNDYRKRKRYNLPIEKAELLIDFLAKKWNSPMNTSHKKEIFVAFYGGEPLLNINFIKAVVKKTQRLRLEHNTFNYAITTNGTQLHKHMSFFVQNNFFLTISLDGNKKNNGFRLLPNGRESFCKVIENIDRLQKDYPNFFRKRVFFNAVLHRKNSFKEIKDFFMKRYEKIPSISEVNPVGIEPEKYNDFLKIYRSKNEKSESNKCVSITMKKNIEPSINELRKLIRHYNKYIVWEFSELYYSLKKTRLPTGTCIPFTRRIFITAQGVILPCERVGHQFSLGRFHEDISIDVNAISNNYNSYFDKMSVLCEKCYLNKLCDQCIFQLNLDSSTPTCPNFMNKKKFMEYLSNQISLLEKQPKQYFNIFNETLGID